MKNRIFNREVVCVDKKDLQDLFEMYDLLTKQLQTDSPSVIVITAFDQIMLDFRNKYVKIESV